MIDERTTIYALVTKITRLLERGGIASRLAADQIAF